MILEQLAKRGDKRAIFILDAFDPNQPRDEKGMWTAGAMSGGSGSTERADFHAAARAEHRKIASQQVAGSKAETAHLNAAAAHGHAEAANRHAKPGINYQAHEASNRASRLSAEAHSHEADKRDELTTMSVPSRSPGFKIPQDPRTTGTNQADVARQRLQEFKRSGAQADLAKAFPGSGGPSKDLRITQTEMPAVKEAPVALMAPHSQLPVGNAKPAEPIHDLKVTQKLEAVPDPGREASRPGRGMKKEDREAAAAASAGRWASRASEVASKRLPPLREGARSSYSSSTSKGRMPPLREASRAVERQARGEREKGQAAGSFHSMQAASHRTSGKFKESAASYREAAKSFEQAGKRDIAVKMRWNALEMESRAKK